MNSKDKSISLGLEELKALMGNTYNIDMDFNEGSNNHFYGLDSLMGTQKAPAHTEECDDGEGELPAFFAENDNAMAALNILREHKYLDENYQPVGLSVMQRGEMVDVVCEVLGYNKRQWKAFASLWHCNAGTLRAEFNNSKETNSKFGNYSKELRRLLQDI